MRLEEYLKKDLIIHELTASTKEEVLAELVQRVCRSNDEVDHDVALRVLHERERLGTTGIGDGIAIPHGKLTGLDTMIVAMGRSTGGLDFESLDGRPVHVVFLVLAPEHVAGMHLRILAHISRLLKDADFRRALLDAPDDEALWQLLSKA